MEAKLEWYSDSVAVQSRAATKDVGVDNDAHCPTGSFYCLHHLSLSGDPR